ncbi:PepSY-associated TM helix domain-containing protein [Sphingopyxis terrae]|uniref:PepSY-associated TM helix domain-containing protein n=1 Tax=Sphingopyxis terrae TaxID=33052 RepID=UPI003F810D31
MESQTPDTLRRAGSRARLVTAHRWISLGAAIFWLVQALTGVAILFHWELEDRALSAVHRPTDIAALERTIDGLVGSEPGRELKSLWVTAGLPDRYDVTIAEPGGRQRAIRLLGDGTILRERDKAQKGILGVLVGVHQSLLSGKTGEWIVGISGLLLLSNLILGAWTAWPGRGSWRRALRPIARGAPAARAYSWHRAVGLWAIAPALVLVTAGVLLRFEDGVSRLVGAEGIELAPVAQESAPVGIARAVASAVAAIPGSKLTALNAPVQDDATYRVRLLAPGEIRRAYGTSIVLIDANSGRVRFVRPASEAPAARAFVDGLYAVHTGEIAGTTGRLLVGLVGLWLATMVGLGVLLWARRRRKRGK